MCIIWQSLATVSVGNHRSSRRRSSINKDVLKIFAIFMKYLYWSLFLKIKLQAWKPSNLWKRLQHRFFLVNIVKIFKNTNFQEHLWTLLLKSCLTLTTIYFFRRLGSTTLLFKKKQTPMPLFSWEFCEFFKNTFFIWHLQGLGLCSLWTRFRLAD